MNRSAAEDVIHRKAMLAEGMATSFYETFCDNWLEYERSDAFLGTKGVTAGMSLRTGDGEAITGGFQDSVARLYRTGAELIADMRDTLPSTENFWVSKSMMELAMHIAPDMPDEPLLPPDLPSRQGWMWYETPYRQIDMRRQVLYDNAIMWSAWGDKVRVWHFTDKYEMNDSTNVALRQAPKELFEAMPQMQMSHVFDMTFNEILPRGLSWDTPLPPGERLEMQRQDNDDGTVSLIMATSAGVDLTEQPKYVRSPLAAFIVCIWRLCQQSIADRWDEEPARHARRRMTRAHLPVSPISVITLRRRESHHDDGETHVDWQHRWMVRGHWRKQPYKEENADGEKVTVYRNIYINPYLKGPEDKPLLIRDKVNALIR